MKGISDLTLVSQVVMFHNRRAFDRLVVKYQSPVRRFFRSQTHGDEQLSDDLAQDTFVKAYVNIKQFRGQSSFSTWLYRIAYNVFYDYHRRNAIEERGERREERGKTAGGRAPLGMERIEESGSQFSSLLSFDFHTALDQLSADERTCVTLQLVEGQPIDRIAAITGMNTGTIKSHLSRGKHKLANYLRENGYERKDDKR